MIFYRGMLLQVMMLSLPGVPRPLLSGVVAFRGERHAIVGNRSGDFSDQPPGLSGGRGRSWRRARPVVSRGRGRSYTSQAPTHRFTHARLERRCRALPVRSSLRAELQAAQDRRDRGAAAARDGSVRRQPLRAGADDLSRLGQPLSRSMPEDRSETLPGSRADRPDRPQGSTASRACASARFTT